MVVPPPTAAPCTAATIGLSKLISALIKRACGLSPGPGGFFKKSPTSLPAQNESPAPCQSTTRISSSFAALSNKSARVMYMADVIAFFDAGRFSWTRNTLSERSVTMSVILHLRCLHRRLVWFRCCRRTGAWFRCCRSRLGCGFPDSAAGAQAGDFSRAETDLFEYLFVVLAEI